MNYMVCIPSPDMVSRENCEKVHNILARMSDAYKLNIVPEPVKVKQAPCPEYYRKYRIYKEIRERDGNGEAYLLQEEEDMILSVCRTPEEEALMKGCTYAYRYPSSLVLKSFREDKKEKKEKREARPETRNERSRGEKPEREKSQSGPGSRSGPPGENGSRGESGRASLRGWTDPEGLKERREQKEPKKPKKPKDQKELSAPKDLKDHKEPSVPKNLKDPKKLKKQYRGGNNDAGI